jgi:hypothetical protein
VIKLKPGEHVLLVEHPGFVLATQRVVVEVEKEQPVEVKLQPAPKPCPPPPPPCPPPPTCPSGRLVEFDQLHLHAALTGVFAFSSRGFTGGPGVYVLASYRRWIFGGNFAFLPSDSIGVSNFNIDSTKYTKVQPRWIIGQIEFGRVFPFKSFYTYATVGVGVTADRNVWVGNDGTKESATPNEQFAISWSLGGGIEAMATRWLSFGFAARFGMSHGKRAPRQVPESPTVKDLTASEDGSFPYGTLTGFVSFHL